MFVGLNNALRRQRRRLLTVAVVLAAAGAVVVAHSAIEHGHADGAVVMCLAVAQTAVVAVAAAVAFGARARRLCWQLPRSRELGVAWAALPGAVPARAGPPQLQVFRL